MNKVFIIAEIAQAHDGSLGIAHSYIDALAKTGVDAIKFQTHIAEAESSMFEPFRVNFSYEDKSRYEYWSRMEFTLEQWKGLKQHCDEVGLEFISSPFSCAAVDLLEEVGVKRYKIGSGELNNYLMLQKIAQTGKPIILSSGMSDYEELKQTIQFLKPFKNELSLLQCTTAYPTKAEEWGLNEIHKLKEKFNIPIGFSDHSASIVAPLAATALGASILEFHVVFHKDLFGPDAKASVTIEETKELVKGVRSIETSLNSDFSKVETSKFDDLKVMFGKSLSINKDLKKGSILTLSDLESKKPGDKGISAKDFQSVIGKKLLVDLKQWDFLNKENIA
ncbi:MAG: N-acetylneuraminate synthase [Flavobacterium sp.]|uniref:N-acetylneuraminate synthase family protein n=1 Tax=unclassified Flavobacterium TaxID=196869 RepID=UPI000C69A5FD|nr:MULTISPECIES: N-acetylneuraminate synthase family protein [unclassified Flavobacterium]MBF02168.1 N-acetylneuraminate synthase [Flavobacterium sp.]MCO6164212.1 N-acetylneuraminate synthase family protein [Flavobacterium sp. NRK F7]|tara:strand:- start:240 stop:1244 length:1005 start_codon:yes stop_codon:yes gene_type:complete